MYQVKQNVIYIKTTNENNVQAALKIADETFILTLETSLICILLLASRDVHFDKRMICFLSDLL